MPEPGAGPGPDSRTLDDAPSQPPGTPKKADRSSLVQNQMNATRNGGNLGADNGQPQIQAIQGLSEMRMAAQKIGIALPALAPGLSSFITNLQQVIPQAMADQLAGLDNSGAAPPISGGAPSPPPPSSPMVSAPVAGAPPMPPAPPAGGP